MPAEGRMWFDGSKMKFVYVRLGNFDNEILRVEKDTLMDFVAAVQSSPGGTSVYQRDMDRLRKEKEAAQAKDNKAKKVLRWIGGN